MITRIINAIKKKLNHLEPATDKPTAPVLAKILLFGVAGIAGVTEVAEVTGVTGVVACWVGRRVGCVTCWVASDIALGVAV